MKRYLEYKQRVKNYKDIAVTVKTIEQVAASQIHAHKKTVEGLREYMKHITSILQRLSLYYQETSHPLLNKRTSGKKVLLIITSDKGLVGGLYHTIISEAITKKNDYHSLYVIGNQGRQFLQEEGITIADKIFNISDLPTSQEIDIITKYFFELYSTEDILQMDVLYQSFVTIAEQNPNITTLLPFPFQEEKLVTDNSESLGFPIFDSAKKDIHQQLLNKYIESIFYRVIVEAKLSEFAARTVAMEHASAKIKDFREQLSLEYFKERRISITQKQLESFTVHKLL